MLRTLLIVFFAVGLSVLSLPPAPIQAFQPIICGDGSIGLGEDCDDGNTANGDCCDSECNFEAGGSPCGGDGNACTDDLCDGAGACLSTPDDTNTCTDGDSCTQDACASGVCQSAEGVCGDGHLDGGCAEECDDGNTADDDGCDANCLLECGNGALDGTEECDDGNVDSGDGCSADCTQETAGAVCGNGAVEAGEDCDDGNTTSGDGCAANCVSESEESEQTVDNETAGSCSLIR